MWALPDLTNPDAENLPGWLDGNSLWCLLLFPRAEKSILEGLTENWDRFSMALGSKAHVITLLDGEGPNSGQGLRFPKNYDAQVGRFCNDLHIRLDHLPAVILLNASDGRGAPYWSLRRESIRLGSAALESLTSDICASTFNLPQGPDPAAWRTAAARRMFDSRSAQDALKFLNAHRTDLALLTQRLLRSVTGLGSLG